MRLALASLLSLAFTVGCGPGQTQTNQTNGRTSALANGDSNDKPGDPNDPNANGGYVDPNDPNANGGYGNPNDPSNDGYANPNGGTVPNGDGSDPSVTLASNPSCVGWSDQLPSSYYEWLSAHELEDYDELRLGEAPQLFSGPVQIAYPPTLTPHGGGCQILFVVSTSTGSYFCYYRTSPSVDVFVGCEAFGNGVT